MSIKATAVLGAFKKKGYFEISQAEIGAQFYDFVYKKFDRLIHFIDTHPEWTKQLFLITAHYLKLSENKLYGSPGIGYMENEEKTISYFHYTEAFHRFLLKKHPELLKESEELQEFLLSGEEITHLSNQALEEIIQEIDHEIPLSKSIHTKSGKLATWIKIAKYEPLENAFSSHMHYDFSALSLLLDNNEEDKESLLLAPCKKILTQKDFLPPRRKQKRLKESSSALVIPGILLKHLGLDIKPTPHGVIGSKKCRFAVVAFCTLPNVQLHQINIPKKDLPSLPNF